MKRFLFCALTVVLICSGRSGAESTTEAPDRTLSKFETSLVGTWFRSGDQRQRAYVASAGAALFSISETKRTLELYASDGGSLLALGDGERVTGVVNGDTILWDNGAWWSRRSMPAAPIALEFWRDGASDWIDLGMAPPATKEGCADFERIWHEAGLTRVSGREYPRKYFLPAHAPAKLTFTFDKPITEFRALAAISEGGRLGSVVFKVETDAGLVFTSQEIRSNEPGQTIRIKFAPTRSLRLITEQGGDNYEDWANWIAPEVR